MKHKQENIQRKKLEEALTKGITPKEFIDNYELYSKSYKSLINKNIGVKDLLDIGLSQKFIDFCLWKGILSVSGDTYYCSESALTNLSLDHMVKTLIMIYKAQKETGMTPKTFLENYEIYRFNYDELTARDGNKPSFLVKNGFTKDFLTFCIKNKLVSYWDGRVRFIGCTQFECDLSLELMAKILRMFKF